MTHKTFSQRLDDLVGITRIPDMVMRPPRRRPLRWLSTFAIAAATIGLVIGISWPAQHWLGYTILMFGFCIANFMPIWGPLKPWNGTEVADERERMLRARAFLVALSVISGVSIFGMWTLVGMSLLHNWDGGSLRWAITELAFYVAVLFSALPTCVAS